MKNKLNVITKLFGEKKIRTVWNNEEEKYYISVVDIVTALVDSNNPRHYWNALKSRLKQEGNETVTNCDQLKLKAQDGKYRLTDVVDIEGVFRIIESIPSKNAEPMKLWLARLGKERIDETFDASLAIQRAIDNYRSKGYDEAWIQKRIRSIQDRQQLTEVWRENGITEDYEFAILTNEIYKTWSGMTAKEYKEFKGLRKESLRDNMDNIEVILTDLGEEATKRLARKQKPQGLEENKCVAKVGGNVAKIARDELEKQLDESVVTDNNYLTYEYEDNKKELLK